MKIQSTIFILYCFRDIRRTQIVYSNLEVSMRTLLTSDISDDKIMQFSMLIFFVLFDVLNPNHQICVINLKNTPLGGNR